MAENNVVNPEIKEAIRRFYKEDTEENLNDVITTISWQAGSGGNILMPVDISPESQKILDALTEEAEEKENGEMELDEDMDIMMKSLESEDGSTLLAVFTDDEEMDKGAETARLEVPLYDFLSQAQELTEDEKCDVEGIIINPWGDESFHMPGDLIRAVINTVDQVLEDADEEENVGEIDLVQGDITKLDVECIVNAANNTLLGGGGVDGAIHAAAGPELQEECRRLHGCRTGEAKITYGYNLPCEYVIHTVGPIYSGKYTDKKLLQDCYWNSLNLAREHGIRSIAFPCISTGIYGYPIDEAVEAAVSAVLDWLTENEDYVINILFCCYDKENYQAYEEFLDEVLGEEE